MMKTSEHIEEVMEYIFYSEMGGKMDYTDPWYPTYHSLSELRYKVWDEEDMELETALEK